jgi:hypothetical protein
MPDFKKPMVYDPSYIAFTIPDFKTFGNLLHDRLHAVLYYMEELSGKTMLITNLFDRDSARVEQLRAEGASDLEVLLYCGTEAQRRILEKDEPIYWIKRRKGNWDKDQWQKERNQNWKALNNREISRDMEKVETFQYFEKFRGGELDISSIEVGTLKKYFENLDNDLQINEHPIIADYFDINKDQYVGIPLLGLGRFQGIVWIVFTQSEAEKFKDSNTLKRIIKLFGLEYDNLLMSWVEFSNKPNLSKKAIDDVEENNPIHQSLKTRTFYRISDYFHDARVKQNNQLLEQRAKQNQKNAIISILLDSYAHNIGAHSLTALSWWFRERAVYLSDDNKKNLMKDLGREANTLVRHASMRHLPSLSRELYPLFKFLQEKGAFWSGINRLTNNTGKVSSMYNVLWFDFVNNSLYLGSLAYTEYIRKLHIYITFYEEEQKVGNSYFVNVKKIKRDRAGNLLSGHFVSLDMVDFDKVEPESGSPFIKIGEEHGILKSALQSTNVFFPGGVVGKHAFFTLIENEIRNVKHFKDPATQADMQNNGMNIHLSFHERPVDSKKEVPNADYQLIKVGVWIDHSQEVDSKLLLSRIENLDQDVVYEDTARPRLGGTSQDKICASMLLTSSFEQAQEQLSALSKIYYPWVKAAACNVELKTEDSVTEFEVSHRYFKRVGKEQLGEEMQAYIGEAYLKKYFHLWKGEHIKCVEHIKDFSSQTALENYARFKFLHLHNNNPLAIQMARANGMLRVLTCHDEPKTPEEAFKAWLPTWVKHKNGNTDAVFDFTRGSTNVGRISYSKGQVQFDTYHQIRALLDDDAYQSRYDAIETKYELLVEHATEDRIYVDKFNFRKHGMLIEYYCQKHDLNQLPEMPEELAMELFEVLCTNICIIDNRIYERFFPGAPGLIESQIKDEKQKIQFKRLDLYREQLLLDVRSEDLTAWNSLKAQGFMQYHFVVVHLSFIESLGYAEHEILDFVDEHILEGKSPESVLDNFILVITTGRGRNIWWEKTKEKPEYARFIAFRSLESMLAAVETALLLPDDFELKHNLVKVLFGS